MFRFRFPGWILLAVVGWAVVGCSWSEDAARRQGEVARAQLQAGKIEEAQKTIAAAILERGDIVELQLLRAEIEMAANAGRPSATYDKAYEAFRQAVALDVVNVQALEGVAQLGLMTGHIADAQEATDQLLAMDPNNLLALLSRGLLQLNQRRFDEAQATADQLLALKPDFEGGLILKARVLLIKGDRQAALDTLDKGFGPRGPVVGNYLIRLEIAREDGDADAMLAQFVALRKLMPVDFNLRMDEANLRFKMGDPEGAKSLIGQVLLGETLDLESARKFIDLLREYHASSFNDPQLRALGAGASEQVAEEIGNFLLDSGYVKALHVMLEAAPAETLAGLRARSAAAEGRDAQALELAEDVLDSDKTDCQALLARSAVLFRQRQTNAAVLAAQTAQSQCPQIVGGWLALAYAYRAKGDVAGVRRVFEQGITENPRQSFLPSAYADWLLTQGQGAAALAMARRLTQQAPALTSGWVLYRKVAAATGDADALREAEEGGARADAKLGVDLVPGEPPAHGLLYARLNR